MKLKQKIWKTGSGDVITIPKMAMKLLELEAGDKIEVEITKSKRKAKWTKLKKS